MMHFLVNGYGYHSTFHWRSMILGQAVIGVELIFLPMNSSIYDFHVKSNLHVLQLAKN